MKGMSDTVTYFAQTDARNKRVPFGIKSKDRTKHVYVIGKTGMGKSTLLENMAVQDIKNGEGFAFIDPHGKTAELLLEYIPEERIKDVIYFAPFDTDHPISFNVMEDVGYDKRHLVVAGLMSAFKKIWLDAWSARMEYILSNTLLALLEYPDSTLLSVNRMLTDKEYRKRVVENIKDPSVKSFWVDEFAKYTDRYTQEATPAIQNKVGQFTANPLIRNIIGQPKSSFDFRKVIDERKILIINLSKGRIGESNANLLGSMLITKIYLAAMSRADIHDREMQKLPNFYLYVDEFQSFANESFADILSEARKYKLNLTIAHQYVEQMSEEVRAAVFGNVGTMIMFRVGAFDAETLEKEFAPAFMAEDMVNLGIYQIYLKLMIDGVASHPFSATTLPPILLPEKSSRNQVIENSQKAFAYPRPEVEEAIRIWYQPIIPAKPITPINQTSIPALGGASKPLEKSHPAPTQIHTLLENHPPEEWSKKVEPKKPTPITLDALKTKSPGVITQGKRLTVLSKNILGLKEALKEVLQEARYDGTKNTIQGIKEIKHDSKALNQVIPRTTQPMQPNADTQKQQLGATSGGQKQNEIPEDVLRKMLQVDR
ncbi:MAG: type IV secretion system DNA-binding domain-containing protein [bacterium]|nr:type IV secretion system DNA-binding domain-containing protein [bacterium]